MKTKLKKLFSSRIAYWTGIIIFGVILGISLQFVKAWTEPTAAPPGGNVGAPINTSNVAQGKLGNLGIGTTSPSSTLDVNGWAQFVSPDNGSTGGVRIVAPPSGDPAFLQFTNNARNSEWADINANSSGNLWLSAPGGNVGTNGNLYSYGYVEGTGGGQYGLLNYGWYGGFFNGYGGVYSQNTSGYDTYLDYPGSSWGVLTNGNIYTWDVYLESTGKWLSQSTGYAFGGFYTKQAGSNSCLGGNPYTGACSCPSGFWASYLGVMGQAATCDGDAVCSGGGAPYQLFQCVN